MSVFTGSVHAEWLAFFIFKKVVRKSQTITKASKRKNSGLKLR